MNTTPPRHHRRTEEELRQCRAQREVIAEATRRALRTARERLADPDANRGGSFAMLLNIHR